MVEAIDYKTGKIRWTHKWESGGSRSGLMSTAGNLVFTGDGSANFVALDATHRRAVVACQCRRARRQRPHHVRTGRNPVRGCRGRRHALGVCIEPLIPLKTLLCASLVASPLLFSQQPGHDPLLQWMDRIAQQQLQRRETAIANIRTIADIERRKQTVRQTILSLLGGLPDYGGPLNARTTGRIQAEGYEIEKVIFESLPGFYVTANLYRPNQSGRYPGILLQAGHTQEGKPEGQRLAANLALKGFVVLAFDPVGQGEREQTYDPASRPAAGRMVGPRAHPGGSAEHSDWRERGPLLHLGCKARSRLSGQPARSGSGAAGSGGMLGRRSVDYLHRRSGSEGEGGGAGLLHQFLSSVVCGRRSRFGNELAQLSFERARHGRLRRVVGPEPLADPGDGGRLFHACRARKLVYEEARRWFGLYSAEDKLRFFVGGGPHGTPLETREEIYKWMIRWLKDGQGDFHEQPVKKYSNHELLVTRNRSCG